MMPGLVWVAVRVWLIAWSVSEPGLRFALSELRAFRHSREIGTQGGAGLKPASAAVCDEIYSR